MFRTRLDEYDDDSDKYQHSVAHEGSYTLQSAGSSSHSQLNASAAVCILSYLCIIQHCLLYKVYTFFFANKMLFMGKI